KDMGAGSFYQGQTSEALVARLRERAAAPEVLYLDDNLSPDDLAGLYAACDCLAHPYRGEGFGLPIVEAMASGLPVIVTGYGAALDFCNDKNAFLVPGRPMRFPEKRLGKTETVDYPWLAEPDPAVLQSHMRSVVAQPAEARKRGETARAYVLENFTWDRATDVAVSRLQILRQQPIRRFTKEAERIRVASGSQQ